MTIDEFEGFIRQSFIHHGLPVDRCSQILFFQLAHMPAYRGLNLGRIGPGKKPKLKWVYR